MIGTKIKLNIWINDKGFPTNWGYESSPQKDAFECIGTIIDKILESSNSDNNSVSMTKYLVRLDLESEFNVVKISPSSIEKIVSQKSNEYEGE